eukprot:2254297-Rhodomonas_salina.5
MAYCTGLRLATRCPVPSSTPGYQVAVAAFQKIPVELVSHRLIMAAFSSHAQNSRSAQAQVQSAIGLRACYAQSGADVAHGGYRAMPCLVPVRRYAMRGTDVAYGAARSRSKCYWPL